MMQSGLTAPDKHGISLYSHMSRYQIVIASIIIITPAVSRERCWSAVR